jgi:hypothetical protein
MVVDGSGSPAKRAEVDVYQMRRAPHQPMLSLFRAAHTLQVYVTTITDVMGRGPFGPIAKATICKQVTVCPEDGRRGALSSSSRPRGMVASSPLSWDDPPSLANKEKTILWGPCEQSRRPTSNQRQRRDCRRWIYGSRHSPSGSSCRTQCLAAR